MNVSRRMSLWPLFLISGAAVGYEIALTRYFAVAKWSEYGYWVISIVMAGFALSGVAVAVARDWAVRRGAVLLRWMPVGLLLTAAGGFWAVASNPFNPLQLQNTATYGPQLWNIALYYLALLPFFFLTGLTISLVFVLNGDRVGRVYGFDLTGAGAGAAAVLLLMQVLHPFQLVPALLLVLAASVLVGGRVRWPVLAAAGAALVAGEALLLLANPAGYNEYKGIYAPLHVPGAKQVLELRSPRGVYALLDDFTERVDVDLSNNADMLGVEGPPGALGVYRDGTRVAALPRAPGVAAPYAAGTLDALPYALLTRPRVLLEGASGGFRVAQALRLGAARVDAVEPDPVLRGAMLRGLGPSPALAANPAVRVVGDSPFAAVRGSGGYDLIDIAGDFLDAGEANAAAFSAEAFTADVRALRPGGMLSVPVSIRDLPAYALRVLATVREGLRAAGMDPASHVLAYRSAWNLRVLVSAEAWTPGQIAAAKRFCDERSFDVSYYPGMDVVAARAGIYNDLPAVNFESGEVASGAGAADAVADEAGLVLQGEESPSQVAFNLAPITLDRPAFYSILRLGQVPSVLKRIEILPQPEVGQLVNLAVLAQAAVLAVLVLAVPLLAPGVVRGGAPGGAPEGMRSAGGVLRAVLYFASLGLGFLFIEIVLIDRASFYLNDRTSAFALVLTGMLVCSGAGSLLADRVGRLGIWAVGGFVVVWCGAALVGLEPLLLATVGLPWAARVAVLGAAVAPVSVALGMPFPMGLARAGQQGGGFLPWAWAVNGAFSVVATPLANLLSVQVGFQRVLLAAGMLYAVCILSFPVQRKSLSWQVSPTH